jgi:hypothetical protein
VEFLVISLFFKTKIPMVDMKVQVYSKFSKNKIWKKMKSPSSMRNGRFHPLKWGKLQKMGVLYIHSSKMLGPSPNFIITPKSKKFKKNQKVGRLLDCQTNRAAAGKRSLVP